MPKYVLLFRTFSPKSYWFGSLSTKRYDWSDEQEEFFFAESDQEAIIKGERETSSPSRRRCGKVFRVDETGERVLIWEGR